MSVKVVRIYELDGIVNARLELKGGFFEVEVPAGPVAGGYINKRLSVEQFAEFASTSPSPDSLTAEQVESIVGDLLKAGTGITITKTTGGQLEIACSVSTAPVVIGKPAAPTAGVVDDIGDTFSFLPTADSPSFSQYKVAGLPGVTGAVPLDGTNSYVQGSRTYIKVVGAVAKGGLAVYVAGSGSVPDGEVLTNADPFTGTAVVVTPPATAALTAALAISVASIMAGNPITFEVTAGGGTAPYSYAVKATNNATGATTVLGSSASGSFTPQTAASYNIDATVTDSTGKVAQAVTRTVQVTAPQSVNQLPVANAGDDLTITQPTSSAALMGTASDPDANDTLTPQWRQITGPNNATGLPATSLNVVVSNLVPGTYQFGFQATDSKGGKSTEDFVVVNVNPAVVAGAPQILSQNDRANTLRVEPASSSSEAVTALLYSVKGGAAKNVLPGNGRQGAIPLGNIALSASDVAIWSPSAPNIKAYNTASFTPVMPATHGQSYNVTLVGDSLVEFNLWQELPGLLTSKFSGFHKHGVQGRTLGNLMADAAELALIDSRVVPGKVNILVEEHGRNDVTQGVTAAAQKAMLTQYIADRKAAGYHMVIITTVTPSQFNQLTQPAAENLRLQYNDDRRASYSAMGATAIIDFGDDAEVGQYDSVLNSTLYNALATDRTHPTPTGNYKLVQNQAAHILLALPFVAGIVAPQRAQVGDLIEDNNTTVLSYSAGTLVSNASGYVNGSGRYFPAGVTGTFTLLFNGGGVQVPVIQGVNVQQEYFIDNVLIIPDFNAAGDRLIINAPNNGEHTFQIRSKAGAPGVTSFDQALITAVVVVSRYENGSPRWQYTEGEGWYLFQNAAYSGGYAMINGIHAKFTAPAPVAGFRFATPVQGLANFNARIDGGAPVFYNINPTLGYVDIPCPGGAGTVFEYEAAGGGPAAVDWIETY